MENNERVANQNVAHNCYKTLWCGITLKCGFRKR